MSYVATMREMKKLTHHNLNVLHIYCRLVDMGVKKLTARRICCFVEKTRLYHLLYIDEYVLEAKWWLPRINWRLSVIISFVFWTLVSLWAIFNTTAVIVVFNVQSLIVLS